MALLSVAHLTKTFGGLTAVNDLSFEVKEHEIFSVIGPNGAGKSTLFKLLASFEKPTRGKIIFQQEDVTGLSPHLAARKGIIRTFQENTIFKRMTVLETVVLAHHQHCRANEVGMFFRDRTARKDEEAFLSSANYILQLMGLYEVKHELAGKLPHGLLRALGIAMALAARPRLLLLDEPFAGLNPEETSAGVQRVQTIRDEGITVVLVEHDMRAVMAASDRILAINFGIKIAEGTPTEIQRNEQVIEAYLGAEDEELGL